MRIAQVAGLGSERARRRPGRWWRRCREWRNCRRRQRAARGAGLGLAAPFRGFGFAHARCAGWVWARVPARESSSPAAFRARRRLRHRLGRRRLDDGGGSGSGGGSTASTGSSAGSAATSETSTLAPPLRPQTPPAPSHRGCGQPKSTAACTRQRGQQAEQRKRRAHSGRALQRRRLRWERGGAGMSARAFTSSSSRSPLC